MRLWRIYQFLLFVGVFALAVSCEKDEPVPIVEEELELVSPAEVSDITTHGAWIHGDLLDGAVADSGTVVGIKYSHSNTRYIVMTGKDATAELLPDGSYSIQLEELCSDTTYYYTIYHTENGQLCFSPSFSFHTHKLELQTDSVEDVIAYGARFGYTMSEPTDRSKFQGSYGILLSLRKGAILEYSTMLDTNLVVRNLNPSTTYYYRAYVMARTPDHRKLYSFGEVRSFTTPPIGSETLDAEEVGIFSAKLGGKVNVMFSDVVDFGILCFQNNTEVTLDSVGKPAGQTVKIYKPIYKSPSGCGPFYVSPEDLEACSTYYYRSYMRMYVTLGGKRTLNAYYGEVKSFRTNEFRICDSNPVDLGLSVSWAYKNFGALKITDIGTEVAFDDLPNLNLPDGWRVPSREEAQELVDKCHWTWVTYKKATGVAITGPNGNTMFVPANGKTGSSYSWGVYMFNDLDNHSHVIVGDYVQSIRFAKDEERDNQSAKTTENYVSKLATVALRLVR